MKLAILSRNAALPSNQRLLAAAQEQGHEAHVIDPQRCLLRIATDSLQLQCKGLDPSTLDAVLPRFGPSITRYGTTVLRQFELMGVFTPNRAEAIVRARDKLHCHQCLAAHGIPQPLTVAGDSPDAVSDLLTLLGEPPHVIKLNEGSQGMGVVLSENHATSRSMIEAFHSLHAGFLVQTFIAEARGTDIRAMVVGDKVIASMQRMAGGDEFRSNLHRGGKAQAVTLDKDEHAIAMRAAKVLGLAMAGVDILRTSRGPLVLEVNASPGLEGIEAATGVDVAGQMIHFLAQGLTEHKKTGVNKTHQLL